MATFLERYQAGDHSRAMAIRFMNKALAVEPEHQENRGVWNQPTTQTASDPDKLELRAGGRLPLSLRALYERAW